MDISQFVGTDLIGIINNALIINFATLGAKMGYLTLKQAIHISPIPIEFDLTKQDDVTIFNVLMSLFLASIISFKTDSGHFIWYSFTANSLLLWFSALLTWKICISQLVELVPSLLTAITNKIKTLAGL